MGVGFQGGKIRLWGGNQFFDVLVDRWLIVLGCQEVIATAFQHDIASRFGLSVQGVQGNQAASEVQVLEELAGDGDFVGFGIHDGAAQIILAGHADGSEHALAAAMLGLFTVQGDQLILGRRAA